MVAFSPASLSCKAFNIATVCRLPSSKLSWEATNMNCLAMVSTDDFTSQYRCGCHRPPSCQEVCGPGVKNRISWFMDLHGWPRHLDALNARLHARQAGPTWITAVFQRRKRLDLKVFSGTPPCKDQWVKNSAGERFCETMIELCNYDIWDKESLCADGSCSTRGGGPTYSIELIYECRK